MTPPLMRGHFSLTLKRGIVAGLGIFGLGALLSPWAAVRDQPSVATWAAFLIHLLGPVLALALLSRWPPWPRLKPDVRFGIAFLAGFVVQVAGFTVADPGRLAERAIVGLIVALSMTALWWVTFGQKLGEAS